MSTNPVAYIPLIPCESSQISAYGYDEASQTLEIQFPGRGPASSRYRYADVPADVYAAFHAAESKGKFFGSNIRGRYVYEKQPDADGVVFGLQLAQEPKYTTSAKDGRLVNRATGKPIPDDEPVFVLRAKDVHALEALRAYLSVVDTPEHAQSVRQRINAFEAFTVAHADRMKFPDTAAA